ncbi:MAG: type II toxin-antitoxin system VapC family toxin [Acidobacteria bacterium]|nr:type II toxin-antitoxin system VapC family toxin [Acidobacteriota bacterium]
MKLLLDTHIFLWFILDDGRLPELMRASIEAETNEVFLSTVSVWEIAIKYQLNRLPLPKPPSVYIPEQRALNRIQSLPLDETSAAHLQQLPSHHSDPFDRMLICQAITHDLMLVSVDAKIQQYSVKLMN